MVGRDLVTFDHPIYLAINKQNGRKELVLPVPNLLTTRINLL